MTLLRKRVWFYIILLFLACLVVPFLVVLLFQVVFIACLGWAFALYRFLASAQPLNFLIWFAALGFVGFLTHRFARQLNSNWKPRWSFALFGAIWLTLFATMSIAGVAHQIGWFAATRPKIFEGFSHFRSKVFRFTFAAKESDWDHSKLSRPWLDWEDLNIILQTNAIGKVTNAIVIDRERASGFISVTPNEVSPLQPLDKLPSLK